MEYARMHILSKPLEIALLLLQSIAYETNTVFQMFSWVLFRFSLKMARHDSDSDNNTRTTNDRKLMRSGKKAFEVTHTHTHTHMYALYTLWERRVQIGVISRFAKSKYWKLWIDDHMVTNWCLQFVFSTFLQFIVHLRHVPTEQSHCPQLKSKFDFQREMYNEFAIVCVIL